MDAIERASDPWLSEFREDFKPGAHVLDLGCGTGDDTVQLLEYGVSVTAIDQSEERIQITQRRTQAATALVCDMRQPLPFDAETFDVIVASLSLHYFDLATTERIVEEIARLLKLNGVLLARVNRVGDIHFDYGSGIELEPEYFELPDGFRKRFFTEESFRAVLENSLEVESIEPATSRRWGKKKLTLVAKARRVV